MTQSSHRLAALTPVLAVVLACGAGEGGSDADGMAGPDRMLAWEPEELYAVGGFDAPDWATFGEVADVGFDAEGNLYLFDSQVAQVTVVSPEGDFLRTVGRRGDGPGEIGTGMAMAVFPDGRIAISDLGKRGVVLYDREGEWLGNVLLDMTEEGLPGGDMLAHPDGGVISAQPMRMFVRDAGADDPGEPEARESRPVFLYPTTEDGESREIYAAWDPPQPPDEDGATMEAGSGGNRMMFRMSPLQAFEPGLHVAVLPDGRVAVADSTDYRIRLFDPTGAPSGELRRPLPPVQVTDRIREMERDRRLAELEENGGGLRLMGGGGGVTFDQAQVQQALRDRIESMTFYPEVPVVTGVAADASGRLWVQRAGAVPGEEGPVDLITPDGRYLGSLEGGGLGIPVAFGPDGRVAVRETDEYDVVTVRVLRIPTTAGS